MTSKYVLPEKDLLEKAATEKRFERSPLGKELKKQTSVTEKQYQSFHKICFCQNIWKDKKGKLEI